MSLAVNCH